MKQNSETKSDYELAQAIGRGAIRNIETLYDRHKAKVYSVCLRMTGNVSEAEDLTQDIFVQLLGKVGSFRGESQFSTWLHRFTTNHVLMSFRKLPGRGQTSSFVWEELELQRGLEMSVGPKFLERVALDTAVAQLPSGCRSVFLKYEVEGYNHKEIARIFGCSVGNSKSQLHKARRRLRKLLSTGRMGLSRYPRPGLAQTTAGNAVP
jgi:RNA polymerase sigma-70 factor (ECF subfamily)